MTTLPQTKSFPWKWNDCMTDSMNHEYVSSSWTRPCLAISLWGILLRNQTTLYQSLLGNFVITIHVWSMSLGQYRKKKKIHRGQRDVANSGISQTHVHWENQGNSGGSESLEEAARKQFLDFYLKSPFSPPPKFPFSHLNVTITCLSQLFIICTVTYCYILLTDSL